MWSKFCLKHLCKLQWCSVVLFFVLRCWHGNLSVSRCKCLAYDPADVTATRVISCFSKPRIHYFFGARLPSLGSRVINCFCILPVLCCLLIYWQWLNIWVFFIEMNLMCTGCCSFPPAATSFILQEFSQYGNILKHVVSILGSGIIQKHSHSFPGSWSVRKVWVTLGVTPCLLRPLLSCKVLLSQCLQSLMFSRLLPYTTFLSIRPCFCISLVQTISLELFVTRSSWSGACLCRLWV